MLSLFYKWVTPWAKASRKQKFINRILGRIANYVYPLYCKLSKMPSSSEKNCSMDLCGKSVIISLTSFPDRIEKLYLCINSLLRQSLKANKVVLWLADTQFPDGKGIPDRLLALKKNGLEIRFCQDIRSYKKIFFTAQEYGNDILVTVDDDTLYPEDWLERLISTYRKYPDCVCCYRAHKMVVQNGCIAPYSDWIGLSPDEKGPDMMLVPIGVGGVLYPPGFFDTVEFDTDIIRELCPTADDLWLKVLGIKNGYKAVKVDMNSKEWFTIVSSQKKTLMKANVGMNLNDSSMKNLQEYYKFQLQQP